MKIITGYTGTQNVTSLDDAKLNASIFGTGNYVTDIDDKLSAQVVTGNKIRISSGVIMYAGRMARVETYEDVLIENGTQGVARTDLIVARYNMDESTGIESIALKAIKGLNGSIAQPENGDMPLFYVSLQGVNITSATLCATVIVGLEKINAKIESQISELNQRISSLQSLLENSISVQVTNERNSRISVEDSLMNRIKSESNTRSQQDQNLNYLIKDSINNLKTYCNATFQKK